MSGTDCCYCGYHKLCTPHIMRANTVVLKLSVLATLFGHSFLFSQHTRIKTSNYTLQYEYTQFKIIYCMKTETCHKIEIWSFGTKINFESASQCSGL